MLRRPLSRRRRDQYWRVESVHAMHPESFDQRFRLKDVRSSARFRRWRDSSGHVANETACRRCASRHIVQSAKDDRRPFLPHWKARVKYRQLRRAEKSAIRHNVGCHRRLPTRWRLLQDQNSAIAPVRPWKLCRTIFGLPVVPEVSSTHSVSMRFALVCADGTSEGAQRTRKGISRSVEGKSQSKIIASISAVFRKLQRWSASTSGGRIVIRRAFPASSINASAVVSCFLVASKTDRPDNSERRPSRLVPWLRLLAQKASSRS